MMMMMTIRETNTPIYSLHALFQQLSILCCKLIIEQTSCNCITNLTAHIQQHTLHLLLPVDLLPPVPQVRLHLPAQQRQLLLQPEHLIVCLAQL
jgi:hypothetical protein